MRIPEDSSDALQEFAAQDRDGQQRAKDTLEHAMRMKEMGYSMRETADGRVFWARTCADDK